MTLSPQPTEIPGETWRTVCPRCRHALFWPAPEPVNTWHRLFSGCEWTGEPARALVCAACGQVTHVPWV